MTKPALTFLTPSRGEWARRELLRPGHGVCRCGKDIVRARTSGNARLWPWEAYEGGHWTWGDDGVMHVLPIGEFRLHRCESEREEAASGEVPEIAAGGHLFRLHRCDGETAVEPSA